MESQMIYTSPMPDEFTLGHLGRMCSLNGVSGKHPYRMMYHALCVDGYGTDQLSTLDKVALASGVASASYVQGHSMIPAMHVAGTEGAIYPHGDRMNVYTTFNDWTQTPKRGAYLCNSCINDDLAVHGFSWFRRVHQLVGVDWCIHHGEALWKVASPCPFKFPPQVWREKGLLVEVSACVESLQQASPFIQRFVAISAAFLRLNQPIPASRLHRAIQFRVLALGLRQKGRGNEPLLSDYVREIAPRRWIEAHIPELRKYGKSEFIRGIDDQVLWLVPILRGRSYAVTMAALFPSVEEVINLHLAPGIAMPSELPRLSSFVEQREARIQTHHGSKKSKKAEEVA